MRTAQGHSPNLIQVSPSSSAKQKGERKRWKKTQKIGGKGTAEGLPSRQRVNMQALLENLRCARHFAERFMEAIFTKTLGGGNVYYPSFTDEDTEAPRGSVTYSRSS